MAMNPRLLRPTANDSPASIPGLALWLDASASDALYTTDAGPVAAVSSPLDISGCVGWWDASDASTMFDATSGGNTVTSGAVARWVSKATGAWELTQSDPGRRPSLTASAINGRSALTFDGSDDFLSRLSTDVSQQWAVFAVAKVTRSTGTNLLLSHQAAAGTLQAQYIRVNALTPQMIGFAATNSAVTDSGLAVTQGSVNIYASTSSGSAYDLLVNGVSTGSTAGTQQSASAQILQVSGYGGLASDLFQGDVCEIIVYPTALSTSDRARVEAYLAAKWGISGVHAPAVTASDPVGYWRDRSGNGRHATQSTAASRPVVGSQNGRKALTFDGSDDHFLLGNLSAAFPTAAEIIASFAITSTDTGYVIYQTGDNLPSDNFGGLTYSGAFRGTRLNGVALPGLPSAAGAYLWGVSSSSSSHNLFIQGANVLSSGADYSAGTNHAIGGRSSGISSSLALAGRVNEVCVYNRVLSAAERRKVSVYLARRWGITLAPQVSNAEAQDWINRVYANGGTVSTSTASAVSTMCDAIEAAGIRDRFYRLNLFCGSNLNAALVPLYRGPTYGGTTYGNATDTNNGPFVSGDYSLASGLWPGSSNSSKYLNTGYKANTLAANNTHLGLGLLATNTINSSFRTGIGAFSGSSNSLEIILHSTVSGARCASFTRFGTATDTAGDVVFNSSLTAGNIVAAWPTVYRDGVATGTDATTSQDYPSSHDMFVFANSSGGATPINYSNPRLGYYSIGATMTSAQALAYSTAMSAFYSAIGRS